MCLYLVSMLADAQWGHASCALNLKISTAIKEPESAVQRNNHLWSGNPEADYLVQDLDPVRTPQADMVSASMFFPYSSGTGVGETPKNVK